jgi:DNA-nicking Smr family endonuclease
MPRRSRPPEADGDEAALFESEVADVRRLEHAAHVPGISYRPAVSLSEREREVLRELDLVLSGDGPFELAESEEYIEGRMPGVDPRVVRRLHKGEFTVQADVDLHGRDAESAHRLVSRLVADAHAKGLRCVRVVHGRGLRSPNGVPVLKASLPRWLSRGPTRHLVLAWATAPRHDGGAGATYVLLRRERGRPSARDSVS